MKLFPGSSNFNEYFWRKLLPAILIAGFGLLFLNFFLGYRLESILKQELKERVANASGGFYSLTFENLSIHLLNGELSIEGIQIIPDSTVFNQWQLKDSLPLNYVEATIQKIDFKGLNLIWLRNYRRLNFRSFEIINPVIKVTDAFYSDRHIRQVSPTRSKTLYEFIEPYIDVVSVDRLNVENASFAFHVESPFNPILYQIRDIDLYTYNFRLDSNSFANGNLLYSENFEFLSDRPQTLLVNNDFYLRTDTILINTKDSLIHLKEIRLVQKDTLSVDGGGYISGEIPEVKLNGAAFKRENTFNSLYARSFNIDLSDLRIFSPEKVNTGNTDTPTQPVDSLQESFLYSFSLYDFISPVLQRVKIEQIDIKETQFDYSYIKNNNRERIHIEKLDFLADNFLIDSLFEERYGIRYIQDCMLNARNIHIDMPSLNQQINADSLLLNTKQGIFKLAGIDVIPVDRKSKNSFIAGSLKEFSIDKLNYNYGLEAGKMRIIQPQLQLYQRTGKKNNMDSTPFSPLFQFLMIEEINLQKGAITIYNNQKKTWNLKNTDIILKGLEVTPETWNSSFGFICDELGFRIENFDNYIQDENYKLQIRKGYYSSRTGKLDIQEMHVIPQAESWSHAPQSYLDIHIPSIRANGLKEVWKGSDHIKVDSIHIAQPSVRVIKTDTSTPRSIEKKAEEFTPFQPFRKLDIHNILLSNTQLEYQDKTNGTELKVNYDQLNIRDIAWNTQEERTLSMNDFEVYSPDVKWKVSDYKDTQKTVASQTKSIPEILYPYAEKLNLNRFYANNISLSAEQPYLGADFKVKDVEIDSLNWLFKKSDKKIELNSIAIHSPQVNILQKPSPANTSTEEKSDSIQSSLYDQLTILGDQIDIHSIGLTNGNLDFTLQQSPDSLKNQKINNTDFSIRDLAINNEQKTFAYENIHLYSENLSIPISNGFYTLDMKTVELIDQEIEIKGFHMNPLYSKTEFAYRHPKHKDWFDVTFDRLNIQDIDLYSLFSDSGLYARKVTVDNPFMQNYKNKQIYVPPKWMPMIYEGLQKAPIPIDIKEIEVNNFKVIYEELAKKATEPGRLVFTELNGVLTGFTNIVSYPEQYIRLEADGKFYGEGHFNAVWLLPVDSLNDRFILQAHLPDMDLTLLNEMIAPLASAQLTGGQLTGLDFTMDAGSIGGSIDMLLLYEGLKVDIFKIEDEKRKSKKFLNFLVNAVVRDNNPNNPAKPRSKPRHPYVTIERDPYHSSFNYLWQLLRPALTESVGITKTQQKIAIGIGKFITKVKKLFGKGKEEEKQQPNPDEPPSPEEIAN